MKKHVFAITVLVLMASVVILTGCNKTPSGYYDDFAKCLTAEGAVMYGAFWCPHCAKIKKNFGDSFKYVTYVECDPRGENPQPDRCIAENIEAYATFTFEEGSRLVGEPSMQELAEKTGCALPE